VIGSPNINLYRFGGDSMMVVLRLPITAPLATAWRLRSACGSASVAGWAGDIAPTGLRTGPGLLTSRWPLARQMEARTAEI
jgi:hypothetical protein